jgi:hypothetical protein
VQLARHLACVMSEAGLHRHVDVLECHVRLPAILQIPSHRVQAALQRLDLVGAQQPDLAEHGRMCATACDVLLPHEQIGPHAV